MVKEDSEKGRGTVMCILNTNKIIEHQLLRNFVQYLKVLSPLRYNSNINPYLSIIII